MSRTIPNEAEKFDYESRFKEIVSFLNQISPIWQDEILHSYPLYTEHYPAQWIKDLDQLSEEELYKVDARLDYGPLKGSSLVQFVERIHSLCQLPKKHFLPDNLPSWAFNKVKEKKQHEIGILAKYVSE